MKVSTINNFAAKATAVATSSLVLAGTAMAAPDDLINGINGSQPNNATNVLFGAGGIFSKVANTLIFLVGAISVIMLIIGGFRYVLSSGNSSAVEGAKNTILYAIIGIIVASLAFAAVTFVAGRV